MFFALSLLFVFALLGLMIYRSELFHETSDEDAIYKSHFKRSKKETKTVRFNSKRFRKTP